MEQHSGIFRIKTMSRVLGVSRRVFISGVSITTAPPGGGSIVHPSINRWRGFLPPARVAVARSR
jgi:hypothetical protein